MAPPDAVRRVPAPADFEQQIAGLTFFLDTDRLLPAFGLPAHLDAAG